MFLFRAKSSRVHSKEHRLRGYPSEVAGVGVGPAAVDRTIDIFGPGCGLVACTVEVHNDTDTAEQLHWHGQMVSADRDGAAEEGTPFIPARGMRRIVFIPRPSGFRFYHTHNRAGADLHAGQYSGQVGPVYIEPKHEPGSYDREVFLVLKEFEPSFSQGGDMAQDFLTPATRVKELETSAESAMKASLAKGMPHGYEVGYRYFTINGRMLGHGEPVRVKQEKVCSFMCLMAARPRFEAWRCRGTLSKCSL